MKIYFCIGKALSNFVFSIVWQINFRDPIDTYKSLPNILLLAKLWTKLVFPHPICPNTQILSLNVALYWKFSLISKKRLKYSFLCFAKSLCFHYFPRFVLANWGDKMSVFTVGYFCKLKFFGFFDGKFFHLN